MIYPGNQSTSGGLTTKARGGSAPRAMGGGSSNKPGRPTTDARKTVKGKQQAVVQWKQRNVKEGIVVVDETQLSKLIKREPIDKFYQLDPEPFATGLFASVRRCVSRDTGQQFAAKFASRARYGEDCSAEIHHEIALLSLCAPSPRVVRLHDVFETAAEIIIVLQFAPGGDLQTIIDDNLVPFECDVVNFVRQLCEGLVYLHDRKIAHLDIKPQNLVMMADFPDCDVKLCDFEISRVILEGTEIREILGTPDYVAPEILHYEPITLAADLWSLGVTTYVLLTGFSPFGGETDQETFCNISRAQLDFPEELFEDVSPEAQEFIKQLLVRDPRARPTAKQCLRHRWFTSQTSPNKTQPASPHDNRTLTPPPSNTDKTRTTPPPSQNLRKYLSKSREALFERAVQQSSTNTSLRKTTLLSQCNRTRRLCESQLSLVSKSREGSLNVSPSFSRSREKLYGLRSLSKSHEMLDLCAAVVAGGTPHQEILKTLTRATTADLSLLLRQTQLPSVEQINSEGETSASTTPNQEEIVDTNNCLNNNNNKPNPVIIDMITQPAPLLSPMLIRNNSENKLINIPSKLNPEQVQLIDNNNSSNNIHLKKKESMASTPTTECCTDLNYKSEEDKEITIKNDEATVEQNTGQTSEQREECSQLTEEIGTTGETAVVPVTSGVGDENCMEEEPRYSVAQLVSAFNRHQEVITKTSLEVTMVASDKDTKILPVIVEASNSKFPTGPNALRLFIPDIDITMKYPPVRKRVKQANNKNRTQADGGTDDSATQKELTQIRETDEEPSPTEDVGSTDASIICRLIIEPNKGVTTCSEEKHTRKDSEASTNYLRSSSLSSDTSDSRTPSDAPSSMEMSWEEFHPATVKMTDPAAVCTGSYVRAAGKFGEAENPPAENNRSNRKSLTVIGSPQETKVNEKQRRKSFY